jgi:hypothetical protein
VSLSHKQSAVGPGRSAAEESAVPIVIIGLRCRFLDQLLRRFTCTLWTAATRSHSLLHAAMPRRDIVVILWQVFPRHAPLCQGRMRR